MFGFRTLLLGLTLSTSLALGFSVTAEAQDTATVRVAVTNRAGAPANASVTLTPQEGGSAYDCRTQNGACEIQGVRPGRYIVTATSDAGRPPVPRVVPVPARVPSIELRVRLL